MSAPPLLRTRLTELTGVDHPIVQTGMGWVAGPRLVSATANAGALGFLASATMSVDELERAIVTVKERTERPFGVNLRADAGDAPERIALLIHHHVRVASFALAPRREHIERLKDHGIVVIPSVGAVRHAEKVAAWGTDAVVVQGAEGGGHTGSVPTSLLIPSVIAATELPVIAAGGFYDGRGLAAALAYGAVGIGMGTRFLLTSDSSVPDAVKKLYLAAGMDGTIVTTKADGVPHRLLRTGFTESLERRSGIRRTIGSIRRAIEFRRLSGMSWTAYLRDGLAMRHASDRTWTQLSQAANTPLLLRAGLVEGDTHAGMLASGQVVGLIDTLLSCEELVERTVRDAVDYLTAADAAVIRPDAHGSRHSPPIPHG